MANVGTCGCRWHNRDHKTLYVRETESKTGKQKWVSIGAICLGCQVVQLKLKGV